MLQTQAWAGPAGPHVFRSSDDSHQVPENASKLRGCLAAAQTTAWENGIVCASIACIIFSFSSLQVKLTGGRVPVLQLCIIRSALSFVSSVAAGQLADIKPLFGQKQHFLLMFLRGFFGTCAIATSYVALLTLPLGDAVTIQQMRQPATAVMARFLLGEPLGLRGVVGSLISVAGVVVVAHPPFLMGGHRDWSHQRQLGTLCGVASTLFATGTRYAVRRIGKKEPALTVALWFHTTTICVMTWPLLAGIPQDAKPVAWKDCLLLLGIATSSFLAQLLMTRSFQLLAAARAAAVSFMGVVYSHILGAVVFHEQLTISTAFGGVLIFIGVVLVTMRSETGSGKSNAKNAQKVAGSVSQLPHNTASTPETSAADSANSSSSPLLVATGQTDQHIGQQQQQGRSPETAHLPEGRWLGLQQPVWLQNLLGGHRKPLGQAMSGGSNGVSSRVAYQSLTSEELDLRGHQAPAGDADVYIEMPGLAQAMQGSDTHRAAAGQSASQAQVDCATHGPFAVQQLQSSPTLQQGNSSIGGIGADLLLHHVEESTDGADDNVVLLEGHSSSWSPWPSAEQQQQHTDQQQQQYVGPQLSP